MPANLIDGKTVSEKVLRECRREVESLKEKGISPKLVAVLVGENPASKIYVNKKHKTCQEIGMLSEIRRLPETIPENEFLAEIISLNRDDSIHGIIVQQPLPSQLSEEKLFEVLDVRKDVDGFHPVNQGKNLLGKRCTHAATPKGIMTLLESTGISLSGKHAVVLGRSNIVGKPIAAMLVNAGCTVTICNSKTQNLEEFTQKADVLVCAVGKPKMITSNHVKEGVVVIDVGINRLGDGSVKEKASWITPVPGGVGPMTIASLIENTIQACKVIECID